MQPYSPVSATAARAPALAAHRQVQRCIRITSSIIIDAADMCRKCKHVSSLHREPTESDGLILQLLTVRL